MSASGYERTSSAGLLNVRFWSDSDIGDDERKGWGNNVWCLSGHHDRRAAVLATQDFLHSHLDPGEGSRWWTAPRLSVRCLTVPN